VLIPNNEETPKPLWVPMDGAASHQLVGEVMAHQGYDG
jgi:hypothetical protein